MNASDELFDQRKVVAIIGSRGYQRLTDVDELIARLWTDDTWGVKTVISGGARGVDRRAAVMAKRRGIPVQEIAPDPEQVERYGFRHAALARNQKIVEMADIVYAFWDGDSTGTSNTIAHALVLGKILYLYTVDGSRFVSGARPLGGGA